MGECNYIMKKFLLVIITVLLTLSYFTSCGPGLNDWRYDLPNGYRVSRSNPKGVGIACPGVDTKDTAVGAWDGENTVVQFCHNDRFVGAQTILQDHFYIYHAEYFSEGGSSINKPQAKNEESLPKTKEEVPVNYFIIDTLENILYGPFATEEEYIAQLEELGIEEMEWIGTYYEPDGAYG